MAKNTSKKDNTPVDNLELIITTQNQEISRLSAVSSNLSIENNRLAGIVKNLEERNKLLIDERVKLRASLYTVSMRLHEWSWCVPQLKKNIKEVINLATN